MSKEVMALLEEEYKGMDAEQLAQVVDELTAKLFAAITSLQANNIDRYAVDPITLTASRSKSSVNVGLERMLLIDYHNQLGRLAIAKKVLNNQPVVVR